MRRWALLPLVLLFTANPAHASSPIPDRQPNPELRALDRDDAAAEAAVASGDLDAALHFFDYAGHEQEDFARASLEYRIARQELRGAVRDVFGRRTWSRAAAALGVPRRGRGTPQRSLRREGTILYVKNAGGGNEIPYVNVDGVWKVSVRNVLLAAVQVRFGETVEYEEADLFVLAGKMGRVLRGRAGQLSALAHDVRAGRVKSAEELHAAIDRVRRGTGVQQSRE
jgi:hypothetical protein